MACSAYRLQVVPVQAQLPSLSCLYGLYVVDLDGQVGAAWQLSLAFIPGLLQFGAAGDLPGL